MSTDPILDGPPVFILIAIIMGLAAYLRQVSLTGQSLIDEIESGANRIFPYDVARLASRTQAKLDLLRRTRKSRTVLTHVLFASVALLAVRVFAYAGSRMGWTTSSWIFDEISRHRFDLGAAVALLSLVVAMWVLHTKARGEDDEIRCIPLT